MEKTQPLPQLLPFSLPTDHKLTIRQAALILVYSGVSISRENSNKYAGYFGHSSGEKLYQDFIHFSSAANRKGIFESKIKSANKIKQCEEILPYLPEKEKKTAEKDIQMMKKNYSMEFDEDI